MLNECICMHLSYHKIQYLISFSIDIYFEHIENTVLHGNLSFYLIFMHQEEDIFERFSNEKLAE